MTMAGEPSFRDSVDLMFKRAAALLDLSPGLQEKIRVCNSTYTVRFGVRLGRLHRIVQAAMGWSGGHLWEFRAGGTGWGPREDYEVADGPHDASKATLLSVIEDVGVKTMRYIYDFGDDWQHTIKVERIFADVPGLAQPFLLEATGRCPPECKNANKRRLHCQCQGIKRA